MNHHEYSKSETDPVSGHDEHDLYFLSPEERKAVINNPAPEGILRKKRERELEVEYEDFSALSIVNELVVKIDERIAAIKSSGGDIHKIRGKKHLLTPMKSMLEEEHFAGSLKELDLHPIFGKHRWKDIIVGIMFDLGY